MNMGFFNRSGKKKEQTNRTENIQAEMESLSPEKSGQEITRFLNPEERYISDNKDGDIFKDESMAFGDPNDGIVRGDPIIINGSDYLLRITDTRMEALIMLYRRFSVDELRTILKENGIVLASEKKRWRCLHRESRIMRKPSSQQVLPQKAAVTAILSIILTRSLKRSQSFCRMAQ